METVGHGPIGPTDPLYPSSPSSPSNPFDPLGNPKSNLSSYPQGSALASGPGTILDVTVASLPAANVVTVTPPGDIQT